MTIGINAYVADHEVAPHPTAHAEWFVTGKYRYQRAVMKIAGVLGETLTRDGALFAGKACSITRSLYATNAVKVYVPMSRGKRADQLDDGDWKRHVGQWYEELAVLAEAGVLPHIIVILSQRFWETAWQTFHPAHEGRRFGVGSKDFVALHEDTEHRANRVVANTPGVGAQELLLLRLRHPAGRGREGTALWLRDRRAFLSFVGLP